MKRTILLSLFLAAAIGILAGPARANSVVVGGTLLTQSSADQLASWLGEGDLVLTDIYSASPGTAASFHAAADGQGRPFSVAEVQLAPGQGQPGSGPAQLVGGYDPVSWNSSSGYNTNATDAGRTAFIFNLSTSLLLPQLLTSQCLSSPCDGHFQTFNFYPWGPTFGGGHDLDLLQDNYAFRYSYGNSNVFGRGTGTDFFALSRLEVYTIADVTTVPEPSTGILGITAALIGIGTVLWRRPRHS